MLRSLSKEVHRSGCSSWLASSAREHTEGLVHVTYKYPKSSATATACESTICMRVGCSRQQQS